VVADPVPRSAAAESAEAAVDDLCLLAALGRISAADSAAVVVEILRGLPDGENFPLFFPPFPSLFREASVRSPGEPGTSGDATDSQCRAAVRRRVRT